MTALHKAFGVCEDCYVAEEFSLTPPHVDGHCWTAADLLSFGPAPRTDGCDRHGVTFMKPGDACLGCLAELGFTEGSSGQIVRLVHLQ